MLICATTTSAKKLYNYSCLFLFLFSLSINLSDIQLIKEMAQNISLKSENVLLDDFVANIVGESETFTFIFANFFIESL